MKYTISKQKVKQALITEPLKSNNFFHTNYGRVGRKTCAVCAVGAVLRNTKDINLKKADGCSATDNMYTEQDLNNAHKSNNFLAKLSCEFEAASWTMSVDDDSDEMRMFLLFLTEAFCPPILEFEA